jgi:hypothetical protein
LKKRNNKSDSEKDERIPDLWVKKESDPGAMAHNKIILLPAV